MSFSVQDLMDRKARTEESAFSVRQIYFLLETWRLRYVAIDTGGWFHTDEVLANIDRFGPPDAEGWPLKMDRRELDAAPRVEDTEGDVTSMPPLVVGPFGNTFSPLMFAAVQADDAAPERSPEEAASPQGGGPRVSYMEKVTDWIGMEIFGETGTFGRVADLRVDDDFVLTHAILEDGTELALSRYRRRADQGHVIFD